MTTTIKDRPILFSAPMVRAILAGLKTQTRRVVKIAADFDHVDAMISLHPDYPGPFWRFSYSVGNAVQTYETACPYGRIGNRLWVRETWQQYRTRKRDGQRFCLRNPAEGCGDLIYAADANCESPPRWRSPIHMPRWASRITLEITDVRVERLQAISDEDAEAEGVIAARGDGETWYDGKCQNIFADAWDRINGKAHPWDSNPWVWVIGFAALGREHE